MSVGATCVLVAEVSLRLCSVSRCCRCCPRDKRKAPRKLSRPWRSRRSWGAARPGRGKGIIWAGPLRAMLSLTLELHPWVGIVCVVWAGGRRGLGINHWGLLSCQEFVDLPGHRGDQGVWCLAWPLTTLGPYTGASML